MSFGCFQVCLCCFLNRVRGNPQCATYGHATSPSLHSISKIIQITVSPRERPMATTQWLKWRLSPHRELKSGDATRTAAGVFHILMVVVFMLVPGDRESTCRADKSVLLLAEGVLSFLPTVLSWQRVEIVRGCSQLCFGVINFTSCESFHCPLCQFSLLECFNQFFYLF